MTLLIASLALMGTLAPGQTPQAVTQMARVSGRVIEDGADTPVTGARVFVVLDVDLPTPADPLPTSVTDQDGRYHFDNVPAGRYRIAAQKDGFAPPMETSTMQVVEVSSGQELDGVTVSLRKGGVIAGRVLDPFGQPLAEAGVTALLKRLNSSDQPAGRVSPGAPLLIPFGQSQTNDLGDFRIFGLSPGEYLIAANPRTDFGRAAISSAATSMTTSTFFPGATDVSAAQPVTVQSDETVSDVIIRLVTVAAFQVSGVVVDDAGAPVADMMVMMMDGRRGPDFFLSLSMEPRVSQSDADGRFVFGDVPAGSYTLRAGDATGFFALSDDFVIDSDGTPRAGPSRPTPAPAPGAIEVIIQDANASDLKIVVQRSQ